MSNMTFALEYAERGWAVFPLHSIANGLCTCGDFDCSNVAKHPRISGGFKNATTDLAQIKSWWTLWPNANIGIVTGAESGIVVLDVDAHGEDDGTVSLNKLTGLHGDLPETVTADTGGGGKHIFFAHPGDHIPNRAKMLPGLDIRADGGYVVAAPSVHASGNHYQWEVNGHPDDVGLAPMPDWLKDMVLNKEKTIRKKVIKPSSRLVRSVQDVVVGASDEFNVIQSGSRNATLTSLAGSMRKRGMDERAIYAALSVHNLAHCHPPLPENEVRSVSHSVSRYPTDGQVIQTVRMPGNVMVPCPSVDTFFDGKSLVPARVAQFTLDNSHWFVQGTELYVYDGGVYKKSGDTELPRLIQDILGEHSRKNRVQEVVYYVQNSLRSNRETVNPDDGLINVKNGLVNWRTGELLPHDPNRISTIQIPVTYDHNAACPATSKFFSEVLPADAVPTVEEMFGYTLIPSTKYQKAFMLTGTGANGKSTFINLLTRFIGEENVSNVSLQDLSGGNRFKAAQLVDKLVDTFPDLSPKALDDSSVFKAVVSGDRFNVEYKGKDPFDFRPFARLVFSANSIPHSRDLGYSFFRRWIILPFPNSFEPGSADDRLIDKLTTETELSRLLNLAIAGLRRLEQQSGFTENGSTVEALEKYRLATDNVATFIQEMCIVGPDHKCGTKELYTVYSTWCDDWGMKACGKKTFNERLEAQVKSVKRGRVHGITSEAWIGIGLSRGGADDPTKVF